MLKECYISGVIEAGCDEAGRGPLAGSVFCAAVILKAPLSSSLGGKEELADGGGCSEEDRDCSAEDARMWAMLNDSKQLTEKQREQLRPWIEKTAQAWAVVEVTAEEIDRINILQASLLGMRRALDRLSVRPEHVIVDGNKWKPWVPEGEIMAVPADTVVKGDGKYMSIAAASILAKTHRDEYMRRLAEQYPQYGWDKNMGYPTKQHYEAIARYGVTPHHRKTFRLVSK